MSRQGLTWYKREPIAFLDGVQGLGPDVIGAYAVLLDLIYARGGQTRRDDRHLSGLLGCSVRKARALTDTLIDLDKIHHSEGFMTNSRAKRQAKSKRDEAEARAEAQRNRREKESASNNIKDIEDKTESFVPDIEREREKEKKDSIPTLTSTTARAETSQVRERLGNADLSVVGQVPDPPPKPDDQWAGIWRGLVGRYNDICASTGWTRLDQLAGSVGQRRAAMARMRWREQEFDVTALFNVLDRASASAYLTGGAASGWRADFDWIMKPDNFAKITEGGYDDRTPTDRRQNAKASGSGGSGNLSMHEAFAIDGRHASGPQRDFGLDADEVP